jgi:hypothetical protein
MKFYRYKQLQRLTFFGYDDFDKRDITTLSKNAPLSRTVEIPAVAAVAAVAYAAGPPIIYAEPSVEAEPSVPPVVYDTKIMRFNLNNLHNTHLSKNAKIVIEQIYLPSFERARNGPITVRMSNLNTNSYDSQNNGLSKTLIFVTEAGDTVYQNHAPEMLYNFSISQNFFQNGYIELELTYTDINIGFDSLERFYVTFVVYDIDEQELLLKDTPDVDYKNAGPHIAFQNKK